MKGLFYQRLRACKNRISRFAVSGHRTRACSRRGRMVSSTGDRPRDASSSASSSRRQRPFCRSRRGPQANGLRPAGPFGWLSRGSIPTSSRRSARAAQLRLSQAMLNGIPLRTAGGIVTHREAQLSWLCNSKAAAELASIRQNWYE